MVWIDEYDRKARLIPGFLVVLPAAVAVVALGIKSNAVIASIGGLLAAIGGPFMVVRAVRSRGLATQKRLFAEWGGAPTTQALRRSGDEWPSARRDAWREAIVRATRCNVATLAEEESDPIEADGKYETAVARLRVLTEDNHKFPMVAYENRSFGYERNLLAVRNLGFAVSGLVLIGLGIAEGLMVAGDKISNVSGVSLAIGIAIVIAAAAFWWLIPNTERARLVANRYAERLLDSAVEIGGP